MNIVINLVVLLFSVIIHEIAHGYTAYRFGDPTAKHLGRLTLNPIPHIDILGSILLPMLFFISGSPVMIGWAKPVPIVERYFKNPLRDTMWVSIAGPLSNISLAVCASVILKSIVYIANVGTSGFFMSMLIYFLVAVIQINLVLAIFNLIPIPPLDGSRVLAFFVPFQMRYWLDRFEAYGFIVIFILAYMNLLSPILMFFLKPMLKIFLPVF